MPARKLPDNAFEHYVSLGPARSYQQVAEHFGVSKRAVTNLAASENWPGRLAELKRDALAGAVELDDATLAGMSHLGELQAAVRGVVTPHRMKGLVAALYKAAVHKDNVAAARFLIERLLGKPRVEPLAAIALDLPDGLESAADVRVAANALLRGLAAGQLSPEDAQKAATVIEAARRSVETEDLEQRIVEIERELTRRTR